MQRGWAWVYALHAPGDLQVTRGTLQRRADILHQIGLHERQDRWSCPAEYCADRPGLEAAFADLYTYVVENEVGPAVVVRRKPIPVSMMDTTMPQFRQRSPG